jgi:D-alanyl-D-alanine carboxypeptidase
MITFAQRLKVLPLIIIIKILGFVDYLGNFTENIFLGLTTAVLIAGSALYMQRLVAPQVDLLHRGIISTFYFDPDTSFGNDVLGIMTRREIPYKIFDIPVPAISAKAALVVDTKDNKVLFSYNSEEKLAPASTTKLMTALVAMDLYNMEDELEIPSLCTSVEGTRLGFEEGKMVKVRDLMEALLISSAGDAACTLATSKISLTNFVTLMNQKALRLGMENTSFTNPVGLDGVNGSHHSTASDLYLLSREAMNFELIRDIVKTKEIQISSTTAFNTNKLLWEIPETVGIKTGTTAEAGEVLIYEYKNELKELVIIVMGSNDRFMDTRNLLTWALQSYSWE